VTNVAAAIQDVPVWCDAVVKDFAPPSRSQSPVRVLRGVSMAAGQGELLSIVGPSGSGKSTLLYCLSGLLPVTMGRVGLAGSDISRMSANRVARLQRGRVGFIFQALNLVMSLSAVDNVLLPSRLARQLPRGPAGRAVAIKSARSMLARLGIDGRVQDRQASLLSGGESQRVAVARVLFNRPQVVFADEPTGALNSAAGNLVLDELRRLARSGSTVVLVTHDLEAAGRTDRVLVLRDGAVVAQVLGPTPDKLLAAMSAQTIPARANGAVVPARSPSLGAVGPGISPGLGAGTGVGPGQGASVSAGQSAGRHV
jgi:putative ABC transport system ATP-binding protein